MAGACRRPRGSGTGRSWAPCTGLRGQGEVCPGQTPRGRFGPPAGSPLPPASPSTLLLKISGEGKQTGWVGAHPPRSGSPFREAKLYFLACCFYNLPTLKIKSLPLPSIGLRLPFLPTPQAAEARPWYRLPVLGLGSVWLRPMPAATGTAASSLSPLASLLL